MGQEIKDMPIGAQVRLRSEIEEFGFHCGERGEVLLGPALIAGERYYVVELEHAGLTIRTFLLAQEIELEA